MHQVISKYCFYLPVTLLKGENVLGKLNEKRTATKWGHDELQIYQATRIAQISKLAKSSSDFYSAFDTDRMPEPVNAKEFFDWYSDQPFLTKQDLIEHATAIRTGLNRSVSSKTTGGSTGEPVRLWKNADALAHERASTWRAYEWAGVSIGDSQLRFWGVPHTEQQRREARLIDFVANRRRISAFDLDEQAMQRHARGLIRFRPTYLYGYASVIQSFAEFIVRNRVSVPRQLKAVITTSEVLTEHARAAIESAFGVKVYNEYGCGEVGSIAHECHAGHMHIMADNVYLEIDSEHGESGEIVVTDLHNTEMPLLRYRVGDFASLGDRDTECGINLPTLEGIHGRAYDMIVTSDGRKMHPESIMYIFEQLQNETNAFRHFQAIQNNETSFEVRVVPTDAWSANSEAQIRERIQRFIANDIETRVTLVEKIPRERSGKLRVVKSLLAA